MRECSGETLWAKCFTVADTSVQKHRTLPACRSQFTHLEIRPAQIGAIKVALQQEAREVQALQAKAPEIEDGLCRVVSMSIAQWHIGRNDSADVAARQVGRILHVPLLRSGQGGSRHDRLILVSVLPFGAGCNAVRLNCLPKRCLVGLTRQGKAVSCLSQAKDQRPKVTGPRPRPPRYGDCS